MIVQLFVRPPSTDIIAKLNNLDFGDDNASSIHQWEYVSEIEQE